MADWSLLPKELLEEIATRLNSQFYILRFRSVCSTWRSSIPHRPRRFPFLTNHGISDSTLAFRLSKRSLFLLSPPSSPHLSWLVKIELDPSHRRAHLLNPLSRSATSSSPLPESFPEFLDLTHFRVYDFGDEYVLHDVNIRHVANNAANLYMEKVAVMCSNDDYVLLTIHVSGKLAIFRSSEKRWVVVNEMPSPYDDVMLFKGEFYAVDGTGRTVRVDLETRSTSLVAEAVYGGDKKFLVESGGEVMVVDMYLSTDQEVDWEEAEEVSQAQLVGCMYERTVSFKVYRVDEAEKRLVRVRNLGDRVLFLGDDCTFSALAGKLGRGVRGNCIYFTDNFFYTSGEEVGIFKGRDIGVFDLESGVITPLSDCPEAAKLFWPPPEWVLRTASQQVQTEFERLAL